MITIFREGIWKIMQLFDKHKQLHLREIARKAGLHEPSATRFLRSLEKEQILVSKKDGNLKKYSLRHNKKTYALLALFDIERLEKLPLTRKKAITHYLNKLPEMPVFAVLFGSTAKGTYESDSDVDILIVSNRKIQVEEAEKEADALSAVKISTFQIIYSSFLKELKLKEDKVVQSALKTGFPLINHVLYYETVFS